MPEANGLEAEIASIVARYWPPAWRCSQYMFDTQDLAKDADARMPEVLDLVERGVYSDEVHFMLYLMRGRTPRVTPALQALARRPDGVSLRARAALQAGGRHHILSTSGRTSGEDTQRIVDELRLRHGLFTVRRPGLERGDCVRGPLQRPGGCRSFGSGSGQLSLERQ